MPRRGQKRITDLDRDTEWLYDRLYDEYVEVVEINVGNVYLRYPHQSAKNFWECACGSVVMGMDELEDHAHECDDADEEWFTLAIEAPHEAADREDWFEEYDHPGNIESYAYQWPLDGHRFSVSEGPDQ